ncbi:hypothetical protein Tco_0635725 [Tanacetum coccineum]
MSSITAQQTKLNLELVPKEKRLEIGKCNGRLNPGKKQRQPTFQVVLDALALTPCYSAFLTTIDVPEVYMHQFWDSIHKYENSYRFRMDKNKKFDLNLEIFKVIFQICPRVSGQNFNALPTDEYIVSFFKELGHTREIKTITNIVVDQMHQPWRTFATIINRSLSGKTTGLDKLRLSRAHILWAMYYKKNVDYIELLWKDFTYHIKNRAQLPKSMTSPEMQETKAYKSYLGYATGATPPKKARKFKKPASPKLTIVQVSPEEPTRKSKRVKRPAKKSTNAPTGGVVIRETYVMSLSKKKEKMTVEKRKGIDLLFEVALTEEAQYEEVHKKSLRDFHKTHPSGSCTVTKIALSAAKIKPSVTNEGTGAKPGVPNVTEEESTKSEVESWGKDEDDSNNNHDSRSEGSDQERDSGDDNTQSDSKKGSDSEHETDENESDSESDQEENEEEIEDDEEEEEDEFVKTSSNDTDDEDETKIKDKTKGDEDEGMDYTSNQFDDGMNVRLNEPVTTNEGFIQKEGTDADMTNVQQGNINPEMTLNQVIEDAHVTLSTVPWKTEVPVTSSSHSSDLASKFLNFSNMPHTDAEIVSPMDVHVRHESLPKEVSNFAPLVIKSMVTESLEHAVLAKESSQPNLTYEAVASLTEFKLKKILIDKMDESQSYLTAAEHRECYDGLIKSYDLDKSLFTTYDKVYSLKRSRKDKDKDEGPSARSDRGFNKRKTSTDAEPTKGPKTKESTSGSSKGTKSQSKSSRNSVQSEEPEIEVADSDMPQDQEENLGNDDEEPKRKVASKRYWFTKPKRPQEPTNPD